MAIQHRIPDELVSFDAYLALLQKDPEHKYEYLAGHVYMRRVVARIMLFSVITSEAYQHTTFDDSLETE